MTKTVMEIKTAFGSSGAGVLNSYQENLDRLTDEQRGLGELMAAYFDRIDPESRDLYGKWTEIPPAEVLERQIDTIETVIPNPDPDRLMPPATIVWS